MSISVPALNDQAISVGTKNLEKRVFSVVETRCPPSHGAAGAHDGTHHCNQARKATASGGLIRRLNIMISLSMRRPRRRSIARYAAAPISVGDRPRVDPEWVTGLCSRRQVRHWIRPLRQGGATQAGQHMASGRDVRDPVPRRIVIDQLRSYPAAKG